MQLRSQLYIAVSQESKELYQKSLPKLGYFNCDAMTLSDIFNQINKDKKVLDSVSARVYFKEAVVSLIGSFKHFKFTKQNLYEDSIDLMYEFYSKIKLNDLSLDEFVSEDKKEDIKKIFAKYDELKTALALLDDSDMILNITEEMLNSFVKTYDDVLIDCLFDDKDISFLNSKKVSELFNTLSKYTKEEKNNSTNTKNITLNKVFDFEDETKEAIKIAKKLLKDKKVKSSDIAIVVSKLDGYKANIQKALEEYNLKGYVAQGKSFESSPVYFEMKNLKTKEEFEEYGAKSSSKLDNIPDNLKKEYALSVNMGLKIAKKALTIKNNLKLQNHNIGFEDIFYELALKSKIDVENRKDAILITEHNQILKTQYKHIIYLGIDSTHLPQRFSDNFLYCSKDSEKLYISNYYKDAVYIYGKLKENCENLHLVAAKYQNKRELQISSVITDAFIQELKNFDTSDIKSLNDILNDGYQTQLDDKTKEFIVSKQLKTHDKYNGILNIQNSQAKSIKFSASRLNEYSSCPLKYYFNYILKAKSPQDFNDDQFDAAQAGTLFHAVVEEFANDYKYAQEKNKELDTDQHIQFLYDELYTKALPIKDNKPYETVLHKQKKKELQVAIDRFKQYVKEGKLDNFDTAEERFNFEMDGNSFTGFIDRIDIDEENQSITLIDYKTTKAEYATGTKDEKYEKLKEFKEFQLPLYHFFVDQDKKYKKYKEDSESYLLTFVDKAKDINKFNHARFGQTNSSLELNDEDSKIFALNDEAKQNYKDAIKVIASSINKGEFYNSASEDDCKWCKYLTICGDGIKDEKKF